jgi:hypothetical protein
VDKRFLVGVLTTRDADKTKRCLDSIDCKDVDVVVIVNTTDPYYLTKVEDVCAGYTVIETSCNGTAGRGKNTVLDYFIQNRYKYLLPIDGDDYYTEGAVKQLVRYTNLLEPEFSPDIIGQLNNQMSYKGEKTNWIDFAKIMPSKMLAAKSKANWRTLRQLNKLTEEVMPFNRFLLLSSVAANSFRYSETLLAADDYLAMYELYSQPSLNYILLKEKNLYYYDLDEGGTLHKFVSEDNTENMISFWQKIATLDFTSSKTISIQ